MKGRHVYYSNKRHCVDNACSGDLRGPGGRMCCKVELVEVTTPRTVHNETVGILLVGKAWNY